MDHERRRVVITGVGVVSPLGTGVEKNWQALMEGRSGIGLVTRFDVSDFPTRIAGEVKDFTPEDFMEKKDVKKMDPFIQYAVAAAKMAMDESRLPITPENEDMVGVIVGVGIGGPHMQEAVFGAYTGKRSRRFVEGLQVMKALWTQPQATFQGEHWQFEKIAMEPKPLQKPHIPLWFGARTPIGLKRAVRHADGWMGAGSSSSADFVQHVGLLRQYCEELKRDPNTLPLSKRVYVAIDNDKARAERRLREWFAMRYKNAEMAVQVSIWGSRAECIDKLGTLVQAGAQHLLLNPVFDEKEHLEELAQDVMPHL